MKKKDEKNPLYCYSAQSSSVKKNCGRDHLERLIGLSLMADPFVFNRSSELYNSLWIQKVPFHGTLINKGL